MCIVAVFMFYLHQIYFINILLSHSIQRAGVIVGTLDLLTMQLLEDAQLAIGALTVEVHIVLM